MSFYAEERQPRKQRARTRRARIAAAYLHVEPLGLLDERGRHGQEDDVRVKVRRAVVGVEALDPRLVHATDDGGHHVKTRQAEGGSPTTRRAQQAKSSEHRSEHTSMIIILAEYCWMLRTQR